MLKERNVRMGRSITDPEMMPALYGQKQDAAGGGRKREEKPALAPFQEIAVYVVFFLTTLGLIFQNQIAKVIVAPTWIICFLGVLLMVLTGVLSGREACAAMNIPMYLLFVGDMAMGGALSASGAGDVVGAAIAQLADSLGNPYLIGLVFFLVPFPLTQVMQNRTVMMIFIPIAIQACKSMGANNGQSLPARHTLLMTRLRLC